MGKGRRKGVRGDSSGKRGKKEEIMDVGKSYIYVYEGKLIVTSHFT